MTGLTKINYGLQVGSPYADRFKGLIEDLEAAGVKIDPKQSGGYNYRNIAGTNRLSNHAYGRALDINWSENARGTKGKLDPALARTLAQKHGLVWGGDWSNPDPMHFEVAGALNAAGGQHNHVHGPSTVPTATSPPGTAAGAAPMAYTGATPDSVAQARRMAQALMSQGMSGEPVGHWTQALGRVLQAGVGSMWDAQAAQGEKEGRAGAQQAMAAALAGGDPNAHVTAMMANPWTADQGTQLAQAMLKNKLVPDAKPATIQEYEYLKGLDDKGRSDFYSLKRQDSIKDAGTHWVNTRTGEIIPKDVAGEARAKAAGKEIGEGQGKASVNLPNFERATADLLKEIDDTVADESLDSITGMVGGRMPKSMHSPGMARAQSRVDKIQGAAFLQAFETLKGGGAITEAEGAQAKAALNRLQTQTMDGADYKKALGEFKSEVVKLLEIARTKAKGAAAPATPTGVKRASGVTWEPLD